MNDSIHVTFNEMDQEISWTADFLKGIQDLCKEDEERLKAVRLLMEETARLSDATKFEIR